MTTTQLLNAIRRKILESGSDLVTNETLLEYVNYAQDDIIKRSYLNTMIASADVTFSSGVGTLPTDCGSLYSAKDAENNVYNIVSIEDFDKGLYEHAIKVENGSLYCTDDVTVTIKYYKTYATISTTADPVFDTYFHELLVPGVLYRVYEDLQDEELSQLYRNKYESEFTLKKQAQSESEESSQDSQFFEYQQLI